MSDASFQKQVLNNIEDSKLSDDDKQALRETLREEKERKLLIIAKVDKRSRVYNQLNYFA